MKFYLIMRMIIITIWLLNFSGIAMIEANNKEKSNIRKPIVLDSRALFRTAKTVLIRHGDQRYTLRLTKNDKVILTK